MFNVKYVDRIVPLLLFLKDTQCMFSHERISFTLYFLDSFKSFGDFGLINKYYYLIIT